MSAAPVKLMLYLQDFPYHDSLLDALDDGVLIAWTAALNCDYISHGLGTYHKQVEDRVTIAWLEAWKIRTSRATAERILAPLVDNMDYWINCLNVTMAETSYCASATSVTNTNLRATPSVRFCTMTELRRYLVRRRRMTEKFRSILKDI